MLKFPYGLCDFYSLITEDYVYVDRSDRIPLLEQAGKQLLFLRPRRFGKSLLLSTLENYYDVARADEFQQLFGRLAIGQNPTPLHNQYFILKWDFSLIDSLGQPREIEQSLHRQLNAWMRYFATIYQDHLPEEIRIDPDDALVTFQSLLAVVQRTPYRLYLLIDEYDNFANEVLMSPSAERYKALLYGEGALKRVFKAVKAAGAGRGLDRAFITGVSPVVLSDLTSGYNIARDISLKPELNDLCGFGESEVQATLQQMPVEQAQDALTTMRTFYNGYAFAYGQQSLVYNPTLALYFLQHLQEYGQYPRNLLDSNLAMDRGKIAYVAQLPNGESVVMQALDEQRLLSVVQLADRFGVEDMLQTTKDHTFMASLLYYFGVLTLAGQNPFGELSLRIPNLVVRRLYVERLRETLLPESADTDEAQRVTQTLYQTGDMQPLCDFIEGRYFRAFDNRDYRWANELTVKTAFLTLLFNDTFYIMDSETALERDYADLTMIVRPDMRQYQLLDVLIEFKYVGLQELGLTGDEARQKERGALAALPPVAQKLAQSQRKLGGYRATLQSVYGDHLRLRVYSVVAIGFERLLWQELAVSE
jgi:hypothetical protein